MNDPPGWAFTTLCMLLIAGALGAVLYVSFGFAKTDAALVAIAALTGPALLNAVTTRERGHSDVGDKIADLARGTADPARQVGEIGRRMAGV